MTASRKTVSDILSEIQDWVLQEEENVTSDMVADLLWSLVSGVRGNSSFKATMKAVAEGWEKLREEEGI